jgi:hypothetical protein
MKIDVNGVSITLTQEQLEEISKQTSKIKSYKDIKSFEIACKRQNIDVSLFNSKLDNLTKGEIALRKLKIVVKAIRSFTQWYPDFSNNGQYKHFVWFDLERGFSSYSTGYYNTHAYVPSALLVGSIAEAKFLGEQHLDLFKDYITEAE